MADIPQYVKLMVCSCQEHCERPIVCIAELCNLLKLKCEVCVKLCFCNAMLDEQLGRGMCASPTMRGSTHLAQRGVECVQLLLFSAVCGGERCCVVLLKPPNLGGCLRRNLDCLDICINCWGKESTCCQGLAPVWLMVLSMDRVLVRHYIPVRYG